MHRFSTCDRQTPLHAYKQPLNTHEDFHSITNQQGVSKREAQKRIKRLAQDFASATPPRLVALDADGWINIEGDDGKHARLSADDAGILIEFLVDTYSENEVNASTESLIAPRLATEASSEGDVIVIVSDYLGTPGPPTRLPPDPAR